MDGHVAVALLGRSLVLVHFLRLYLTPVAGLVAVERSHGVRIARTRPGPGGDQRLFELEFRCQHIVFFLIIVGFRIPATPASSNPAMRRAAGVCRKAPEGSCGGRSRGLWAGGSRHLLRVRDRSRTAEIRVRGSGRTPIARPRLGGETSRTPSWYRGSFDFRGEAGCGA